MAILELPPGEKWRNYELKALGLRAFAGVRLDEALRPFELAKFANLLIVGFADIKSLSQQARDHLLGSASQEWSGGACSVPLPNGKRIVILNPNHGAMRTNATLMEEVSHVFLGHQPNRLKVVVEDERGRTLSRDYRKADEEEAYAVGAAALVPYAALRKAVLEGKSATQIARQFRVSKVLVEYRLKVTHLWKTYQNAH